MFFSPHLYSVSYGAIVYNLRLLLDVLTLSSLKSLLPSCPLLIHKTKLQIKQNICGNFFICIVGSAGVEWVTRSKVGK